LLVDEMFSAAVVGLLTELGHDAAHVFDQGQGARPDAEVAAAAKAQARMLVTENVQDFAHAPDIAVACVLKSRLLPRAMAADLVTLLHRWAWTTDDPLPGFTERFRPADNLRISISATVFTANRTRMSMGTRLCSSMAGPPGARNLAPLRRSTDLLDATRDRTDASRAVSKPRNALRRVAKNEATRGEGDRRPDQLRAIAAGREPLALALARAQAGVQLLDAVVAEFNNGSRNLLHSETPVLIDVAEDPTVHPTAHRPPGRPHRPSGASDHVLPPRPANARPESQQPGPVGSAPVNKRPAAPSEPTQLPGGS
jgi:hypothetical protein